MVLRLFLFLPPRLVRSSTIRRGLGSRPGSACGPGGNPGPGEFSWAQLPMFLMPLRCGQDRTPAEGNELWPEGRRYDLGWLSREIRPERASQRAWLTGALASGRKACTAVPLGCHFSEGHSVAGVGGVAEDPNEGDNGAWVRKILWRRKWQPSSVFLPGESHGQRSLVGYSPWSLRVTTEVTELTQAAPAALPTSLHC